MNIKMTKGSAKRGINSFWLSLCLLVSTAYAGLKFDETRVILHAAKVDKMLTDREKLFVYRCQTIAKYLVFSDTPTGKATKYSCDATVGVAFYAGKDLGRHPPEKVAQYFIDELVKQNVKTEVFFKHDHEYGSSMAF